MCRGKEVGGTGVYGTFELVWLKIRFLRVEGGRGKRVFFFYLFFPLSNLCT